MQPQSQYITITPLGAGQQVGRSCIVCKIKDKTIIFDSGIHMQYSDMQKYPDFKHICGENNINSVVDVVIITHFHLDHCGGLPYLTQFFKYSGPIYATMPTKAMIPYMLEDFRKVNVDLRKDKDKDRQRDRDRENYRDRERQRQRDKEKQPYIYLYTAAQARAAADKIISVGLQQTVTYKGIKITPYYGGHVLGAGMFFVQYDGLSVMYTGDYNSYADRHLGAAYAPRLNPNIIITQTTYATTIRDTKRDRQRKMLRIVSQTVENGGKVLIPVFALGRAQQLSVLLQTYWNRTQNEVPVYFSAGLIEKANFYYKLFVEWQNQKIKQDFLTNNLFNFKKVKPFDKALIRADFPYVLFATPGMLHGGSSLQIFKQWCGNPKNTLIIPGYCVPGTFGNKLLNGAKKLEIDFKQYEVNMKVQNISFSAHADAKGIINLIRHVNAENIVFVHGDKQKMKIFEEVVKEQLGKPVFRPANKQTISISCSVRRQISIKDTSLIPKQPAMQGYLLSKSAQKQNYFKLIDQDNLLKQLNMMRDLLKCPTSTIVQSQIDTTFKITNSKLMTKLMNKKLLEQYQVKMLTNNQEEQKGTQQLKMYDQMEEMYMKEVKIQQKMRLNKRQKKQQMSYGSQQSIQIKGQLKNIIKLMDVCQKQSN